jgi:hypothetical protein
MTILVNLGVEPFGMNSLPCHATDRVDQLLDLMSLVNQVAGRKRIGHTMRHVILENFRFNLMQRRADRIDLRQDVHAVAISFYHPP